MKVAAIPEKGKANRVLTDYLSGRLGIRKSDISIIKGTTSRTKILGIAGLEGHIVIERLLE